MLISNVVLNFLRDPTNNKYRKNKEGEFQKKVPPQTERQMVKIANNTLKKLRRNCEAILTLRFSLDRSTCP